MSSLLSEAITRLTFSLYEQLAKDEENIFVSPFSISTALSMLLCGARENTEKEMREVLHFESVGIPNSEVQSSFDMLLSVFNEKCNHMTLTFANAVVFQKGEPVLSEFKETIEKTYRALLLEADFACENQKAVREINDWVKKRTNEMIPKIFQSLNPSTGMVLLNAVYFKGSWKYQFDSRNTHPKVFYNRGQCDHGKEVPMMSIHREFGFLKEEKYSVLELPYKNDAVVMLLLLPNERDGLEKLESLLSTDFFKCVVSCLHTCKVEVSLPKLDIEYSKELNGILFKLGMCSAFDSSGDFSGINCKNVSMSEVLTKCVLVVNEEGSEAAAVTAIRMSRCIRKVQNEKFEADHPFLFIIYDREKDVVLFIGRVIEL